MIEGFYKKAKITIDEDLTIHPLENFDSLSQNSLGTQIISATLNGWELEDGAVIMFAFEKLSDGYNFTVGPILTAIDFALNTYWIKVPDEVMKTSGKWRICVYKKYGFDIETGTAEGSISGVPFTFNVINTIADNNGGVNISLADVANTIASYNSLGKMVADRGITDLKYEVVVEAASARWATYNNAFKYEISIDEHKIQNPTSVFVYALDANGNYVENAVFTTKIYYSGKVAIILDRKTNCKIIIKGDI